MTYTERDISELLKRIGKAEKYYGHDEYRLAILRTAMQYFDAHDYESAQDVLAGVPDEAFLLDELTQKLKGKSVYSTLNRINKGELTGGPAFLKGIFSLGVHIAIEVEHGHKEYEMLYPVIYEKLGETLFQTN